MHSNTCLLLALAVVVGANDPASSWLSYVRFDAPSSSIITALNTTWVVPSLPAKPFGSNAPGWWFGVMDKDGDGALVQPILAYGYTGSHYTIFNGVFDWTDGSWHTSPLKETVSPGDVITSSVIYNKAVHSYTMRIASKQLGKTITTEYALLSAQTEPESAAVFVLEHQPETCHAYPANGQMSFEHVHLEVDGKWVEHPEWRALQKNPACGSQALVVDSQTLKFTWDPQAADHRPLAAAAPVKWSAPRPPAQCQEAYDKESCLAVQGGNLCTWCNSDDGIHELCFWKHNPGSTQPIYPQANWTCT